MPVEWFGGRNVLSLFASFTDLFRGYLHASVFTTL